MPRDFTPALADLVKKMLTVDPKARITMAEIKKHPFFLAGLPSDYVLPSPVPFPSFTLPVPLEDIDEEFRNMLLQIGYASDDEINTDLLAHDHTMAKVFYFMLKTKLSLELLPWDQSEMTATSETDNFVMPPQEQPIGLDYEMSSFRNSQPSLGINSVADRADWLSTPETSCIQSQTLPVLMLDSVSIMNNLQNLMKENGFQWFHPDDYTIMCKKPDGSLYIIIQADQVDDSLTDINFQLISGDPDRLATLCKAAEDSFSTLQLGKI